jgi:hypothetical protein
MDDGTRNQIVAFIEEEARRIKFGKLLVEVTVLKGRCTNIQAETRRSLNVNDG